MSTVSSFEDLEIWQIAGQQCNDFNKLVEETTLGKNFVSEDRMDASSGSVMNCITKGFERSGNKEFKNMLIISKGSNGEYRFQRYGCLDKKYLSKEKSESLYIHNNLPGNKFMPFILYLQNSNYIGQRYKSV